VASTYTVDASVFLNAFNPYEAGHEESHRLLARLQDEATPIIVPTLLLPEVAASMRRSPCVLAVRLSLWIGGGGSGSRMRSRLVTRPRFWPREGVRLAQEYMIGHTC
jgi:hypothetical protein